MATEAEIEKAAICLNDRWGFTPSRSREIATDVIEAAERVRGDGEPLWGETVAIPQSVVTERLGALKMSSTIVECRFVSGGLGYGAVLRDARS